MRPSLTLKRRFKAAPALVYAAWTEPRHLLAWFGPAGEVQKAEADVRVGGRFQVIFTTPDGEEHDVSGTYDTVAPNEKLAFSWTWRTLPDRLARDAEL